MREEADESWETTLRHRWVQFVVCEEAVICVWTHAGWSALKSPDWSPAANSVISLSVRFKMIWSCDIWNGFEADGLKEPCFRVIANSQELAYPSVTPTVARDSSVDTTSRSHSFSSLSASSFLSASTPGPFEALAVAILSTASRPASQKPPALARASSSTCFPSHIMLIWAQRWSCHVRQTDLRTTDDAGEGARAACKARSGSDNKGCVVCIHNHKNKCGRRLKKNIRSEPPVHKRISTVSVVCYPTNRSQTRFHPPPRPMVRQLIQFILRTSAFSDLY